MKDLLRVVRIFFDWFDSPRADAFVVMLAGAILGAALVQHWRKHVW